MTQVKLAQAMSGHKEGATIEVTPLAAVHLINEGVAKAAEAPAKRATKAPAKAPTKEAEEVGDDSPADGALTAG